MILQGGLIGLAAVTVGLTTEAGPHLEVGELLLVFAYPRFMTCLFWYSTNQMKQYQMLRDLRDLSICSFILHVMQECYCIAELF